MLTQTVTKTESIENIADGTFVYCAELRSGFIKRGLNVLNITDYSFQHVLEKIKSTPLDAMNDSRVDVILFGKNLSPTQGQMEISNRLTKQVQRHVIKNKLIGTLLTSFYNSELPPPIEAVAS